MTIRSLRKTEEDFSIGESLVKEYVHATAREMGIPNSEIVPYIEDYSNFPGKFWPDGDFLFLYSGQKVAGCVGITPGSDGFCEMNRLWIKPDFRRCGFGRKLILASLKRAKELGFLRMGLDVLPTRKKAIELYLSLGFRPCGPLHDYSFSMKSLDIEL